MSVTININGLTLCHKGSGGVTHNTVPDVCKTPDKGIPRPFDNEAYSSDLANGTTTVFADGGMMIANFGSIFAISTLDGGGSFGGIKSGTFEAEAEFMTHSPSVFFEGMPACRLTDKMWMNHKNTVNAAGLKQRDLPKSEQEFFDEICQMACDCLKEWKGKLSSGQTYQDCVKKKIDDKYYNGRYPKSDAPMWREVPYSRSNGWDMIGSKANANIPTSNYIRPDSRRLDITRIGKDGKVNKLLDMKFGKDELSRKAGDDYKDIAKKHTGSEENFEEFRVEERCDCSDDSPPQHPVPVTAPAPQKESLLDKFGKALESSTGLKLTGAALVAALVVSEVTRLIPARNAIPVP